MKIINQSKNTILADEAVLANRVFTRVKGLLGKRTLSKGQGIILKPCNSIHTFFMQFPIDVLFIDHNNRVVKAVAFLKPYRITAAYFQSAFAIELPVDTIRSSHTEKGDFIFLD